MSVRVPTRPTYHLRFDPRHCPRHRQTQLEGILPQCSSVTSHPPKLLPFFSPTGLRPLDSCHTTTVPDRIDLQLSLHLPVVPYSPTFPVTSRVCCPFSRSKPDLRRPSRTSRFDPTHLENRGPYRYRSEGSRTYHPRLGRNRGRTYRWES